MAKSAVETAARSQQGHCRPQWSPVIAGALIVFSAYAPLNAQACRNMIRPASVEENRAAAELVFSGKIIATDHDKDGLFHVRIDVASTAKGTLARIVQAKASFGNDCSPGLGFLQAGQWWTFFVSRNPSGTPFIHGVDTFCEEGASPVRGGPPGSCTRTQTRADTLGQVEIAPGSTVSIGPDRSIASLQWTRLQAGSRFAGIPLPAGTEWFPRQAQFQLPVKRVIGQASLRGRISLGYIADDDKRSGKYDVSRVEGQPGELTLYGAQVDRIRFAAPGWVPLDAILSAPGLMRGIHVQDFVDFAPDGKITHFVSARDEVVDGVHLKKGERVDLYNGRVIDRHPSAPRGGS